MDKNSSLRCQKCNKSITKYNHHFLIQSNHFEPIDSYDTVEAFVCLKCAKKFNLFEFFKWHIKEGLT